MQFRVIPAFLIFLGSYLPLAIILAAQDIPLTWWTKSVCPIAIHGFQACDWNPFTTPTLSIGFLAVTVISTALAYRIFGSVPYPLDIQIVSAKATPNDIINYVFPYVVSFMGISYSDPQKLLGFSVFLAWMFAITYKSGQIIMNPLLIMFGWRLYEANIEINKVPRIVRILKKGQLVPGPQKAQTIQDFYLSKD